MGCPFPPPILCLLLHLNLLQQPLQLMNCILVRAELSSTKSSAALVFTLHLDMLHQQSALAPAVRSHGCAPSSAKRCRELAFPLLEALGTLPCELTQGGRLAEEVGQQAPRWQQPGEERTSTKRSCGRLLLRTLHRGIC